MLKKQIIPITVVASIAALTFSSCQKGELNQSTSTSADFNTAEQAFSDVFKVVDEVALTNDEENKFLLTEAKSIYSFGNCASVIITPDWPDPTFPKTIVIDFGSSNCLGTDARYRRGKLVAVLSDRYRNEESVIKITTDNYFINDHRVDGMKIITNEGRNAEGYIQFNVSVIDGKITTPEAGVIEWNSLRTNELIDGETTLLDPWDDVYRITGSGSGLNKDGREFTVDIIDPLIKRNDCQWISKGVLDIEPAGLQIRKVDFGDGSCDNKAIVTIGNRTYNLSMW